MQHVGDYDYDLRDKLGQGAFAIVYKGCFRKDPGFEIAVKCIEKKKIPKSQAVLSKEIRILKELSSLQHENVVRLLDCKESSDTLYLITEYCNGGDLSDYLREKKTLSEDTIAMFVSQIAAAMEALYTKGIVHRDIKPHNLLLAYPSAYNRKPSEIKIKIADFGFARFLEAGVMAATLCGSPMYMAPEVLMSQRYDAKADLWSIGTIVYQCLTGRGPFHADSPPQLKSYYEKNRNLQPIIPSGTSSLLKDLIIRLLKRNSVDRIEFTAFFNHPFVTKYSKVKTTAPSSATSRVAEERKGRAAAEPVMADKTEANRQRLLPAQQTDNSKLPLQRAGQDKNTEKDFEVLGNVEQGRIGQQVKPVSSDRPVSLPVVDSSPLPVPVRHLAAPTRHSGSGSPPVTNITARHAVISPNSPGRFRRHSQTGSPRSRRSSESSSNIDIGSITPPNITFHMGTPPNYKGQFTSRQRSNTEGSLKDYAAETGSAHQQAITTSNSFSIEHHKPHSSGNRLADLLRKPSFARDTMDKENSASIHSNIESSSHMVAFPYAQSPPNMEGPVMFVVPELTDETLHNAEHKDVLQKLQFVAKVIQNLVELAQSRMSPLLESRDANKFAGCMVFVSEKQRRIEQLVLYIRALQLLSASLQLAKDQVTSKKLHPSQAVRDTVKELNGFYHTCLAKSKILKSKGVETEGAGVDQQFLSNTADKLIYEHAIDLCQQAAIDELHGNSTKCVKKYNGARTLLHSLAEMATIDHDRRLLTSHKKEVEKRLIYLESQGYCVSLN